MTGARRASSNVYRFETGHIKTKRTKSAPMMEAATPDLQHSDPETF